MRPGTGVDLGRWAEDRVVHSHRHHRHALGPDLHLRGDVLPGVLRHGHDGGQRPRHPDLHAEEPEPAPLREPLPGTGRVGQGELPVHRDGVVQGGEQGPPVLDQAEHPVAEALVVVHDVEVRTPPAPGRRGPASEYASGSPKPAVHMMANSSQSSRELNSRGWGTRKGSGSR